jgi:hypothetical protein
MGEREGRIAEDMEGENRERIGGKGKVVRERLRPYGAAFP